MADEIIVEVVDEQAVNVSFVEQEVIAVNIESVSGGLVSIPPGKHYRVTNLWVNKNTGKLHVDYEVP